MGLKQRGGVLLTRGGKLRTVCCPCDCCAAWTPDRTLYLSIDSFTNDAGYACDDACDVTKAANASLDAGELTNSATFVWLDEPTTGVTIFMDIACTAGVLTLHSQGTFLKAAGVTLCGVQFADVILTGYTCDPFYWSGDVTVTFHNPFPNTDPACGTGTITITITE